MFDSAERCGLLAHPRTAADKAAVLSMKNKTCRSLRICSPHVQHYRHKCEKLKTVNVLLLLFDITQIVVEEPSSPIYPIPNSQQPWWANGRTHEPLVGLLIDDHESKSTPHHAEASVRVYYHLDSRKRLLCVTSPLSKAGLL